MQIEELKNEGLKREFKVSVDKEELDRRVQLILMEFRDKVRMKGFRPGKAPLSLLRKLHGDAAIGQAVEESVRENTDKLFREKKLRPAMRPEVEVGDVDAEAGFDFTVSAEVLPEIDVTGFKAPRLERLVAKPDDADIDEALARLAKQSRRFEPAAANYRAKTGDVVRIDFVGKVDGAEFEGGKGEDVELEIGSGQFIPGFEDQLVGAKSGEEKTLEVTFPADYGRADLAGKAASFAVTVKEVKRPAETRVDDEFAKGFGLESLDALRDMLRQQLEQEAAQLGRARLKRKLLDALAESYDFPVPEKMVDLEYRDIWEQIKRDAITSGEASEAELAGKEEPESEEDRKEFRAIAERRVRLGLLLSEIGLANNIEISRDELMRKVVEEARRFPGQEQQVYEFYTKNEQAMAQLRAPLYEDKVVDFILEMADLAEREVSLADLRRIVEEEDEAEETAADEKPKKPKKAKKAKAGKTARSAKESKKGGEKTPAKGKTAAGASGKSTGKTAARAKGGKATSASRGKKTAEPAAG
ncbi:MAG: trigger factor [Rhodothalassiaceae bacterium]